MSSSSVRYIVVGMPRAGTTVTHNCLRGHPSVSAFKEEINTSPFLSSGIAVFTYTRSRDEKALSAIFDAMTSIQSVPDPKARGVKLTMGAKSVALEFVEAARHYFSDVKVIHVVRDDIVARFGSWVKSRKTEVWKQHEKNTKKRSLPEIELDRYDFAKYAVKSHQVRDVLNELRNTHEVFEVGYEETILEGKLPEYDPLFEFIDVEPMEADWLSDRKLSPPPESYIKNYRELCALKEQIWSKLESGVDPEVVRASHAPPHWREAWQKAKFWARRPGYAAYRMERAFKSVI